MATFHTKGENPVLRPNSAALVFHPGGEWEIHCVPDSTPAGAEGMEEKGLVLGLALALSNPILRPLIERLAQKVAMEARSPVSHLEEHQKPAMKDEQPAPSDGFVDFLTRIQAAARRAEG